MLLAGKNQVGFNRSFFQNGRANFRKKFSMPDPFTNQYEYFNDKRKKL
jgi:hypothetical protein